MFTPHPPKNTRRVTTSADPVGADFDGESSDEPKHVDIPDGPELRRICALPRRPIPDLESDECLQLAAMMTRALAKVPNPYPGALRPVQALALREAWTCKGLFAPIVAGGGKMLTCFLAPIVLGARRPIYVCPKKLQPQTLQEFALYRQAWLGPTEHQMPLISYELLSNMSSAEERDATGSVTRPSRLDSLKPDLLIFDEAHMLANKSAAVTERVRLYLEANPGVTVLIFTGTAFKTSINDAQHLMEWSLRENSPLPSSRGGHFKENQAWAGFLDAKKGMGPAVNLGALPKLARAMGTKRPTGWDGSSWRRIVARRMLETPGVIGTQDAPVDVPLTLQAHIPHSPCSDIDRAMRDLRDTQCLPDGTELADDMQLTRNMVWLARGFWKVYDPPPPREWREARNAWAKWCRKAIKRNRKGITSEGTMKSALKRGVLDGGGVALLEQWESARALERARTGQNEPPSVARWISEEAIDEAEQWLKEHTGLVWVEDVALGERLAERLGIPYYGDQGGLDRRSGRRIIHHPGGSAVASVFANGTGTNLQRFWSQALWFCTPGEQSLARMHRPGQTAASVDNYIYIGSYHHLDSFRRAVDVRATFGEDMTMSPQRLKYASLCDVLKGESLHVPGEPARWKKLL